MELSKLMINLTINHRKIIFFFREYT